MVFDLSALFAGKFLQLPSGCAERIADRHIHILIWSGRFLFLLPNLGVEVLLGSMQAGLAARHYIAARHGQINPHMKTLTRVAVSVRKQEGVQ